MRLVITGNSGSLGEALGARAGEGVLRIVPNGVAGDDESRSTIRLYDPEREIEGVLRDLSPDAVVHFPWAPPGEGQRNAAGEVAATLATAAAAARSGVGRLVYWGSTSAYARPGRRAQRPLSESDPLAAGGEVGGAAGEVDRRLQRWGRETSGIELVLLRAAPVLGIDPESALSRLLDSRFVPGLGSNVLIQLLHPDDATTILWRGARTAHPGIYNAAADGLMLYSELCRAMSRQEIRLPRSLASLLLRARAGGRACGDMLQALESPVVADNARLKTHFGYRPRRTVRQAVAAARAAADRTQVTGAG